MGENYNFTECFLFQNYIIDGRDGSRILTMNSSQYQMSSDLTLHTTQNNRDLFIFKVRGRGSHITMDRDSGLHGLDRIDKVTVKFDIV